MSSSREFFDSLRQRIKSRSETNLRTQIKPENDNDGAAGTAPVQSLNTEAGKSSATLRPFATIADHLDASVSQRNVSQNIMASGSATVINNYGANINTGHPIGISDSSKNTFRDMKRSKNAEYDTVDNVARGPCTPETRTGLLQDLDDWSNSDHDALLYWLTGIAGTGKTTVAFSFSDKAKEENRLGASFFCSRSLDDCRDMKLIIPTLAYQLARQYKPFRIALIETLESDPDILRRNLDSQLRELVIKPWKSNAPNLPRNVVIVIDALDECDGGQSEFLKTLFRNVVNLPLKILLTSRPDTSILHTMRATDPNIFSKFVLHEVEKDIVSADIAKYLRDRLSCVPFDVLDVLVQLSGPLFIVAAILARLFVGENVDARARLKLLQTSLPKQNNILGSLDEFYRGVLAIILREDPSTSPWEDGKMLSTEVQGVKDILSTIVCARDPLTREGLATILDITEEEVNRRLDLLFSILVIPDDHSHPIVILHTSLADFMLDLSRSKEFCCHPSTYNMTMAKLCLALMEGQLKPNLCGLAGRVPNNLVQPRTIQAYVGSGLRYAALYWEEHWSQSSRVEQKAHLGLVCRFLSSKLLCWFECLSLSGNLSVADRILEDLIIPVQKADPSGLSIQRRGLHSLKNFAAKIGKSKKSQDYICASTLAYESLRLIQHIYPAAENSATEIYAYADAWMPTGSPLRAHYANPDNSGPRVLCGLLPSWTGAADEVITIHSNIIRSIAISQDGSKIISGSEDRTVRIWNIQSKMEESVLAGHTDAVKCVAITRDGSRIISGSTDLTVRIWDTVAMKAPLILQTFYYVIAVAVSPDNKYLASGGQRNQVSIWGLADAQPVRTLYGHRAWISSLSFFPNSTYLVSGSEDNTARVWNVLTGEIIAVLGGHKHSVDSVACSAAGDRIVTGSSDNSARVWDISGQQLRAFQGHTKPVKTVAFTPNGERVVTGSDDGTLRVWAIDTGKMLHKFTASDRVLSVAVFPDGQKIASSSSSQIDIWSMRSAVVQPHTGETARATAIKAEVMIFSLDGQRVVLLPSLQILDTNTHEERVVLESVYSGHDCGAWSTARRRVAISTDIGCQIEVWELNEDNRTVLNHLTLKGHAWPMSHVSFSHDGRYLCSASNDSTARMWDAKTGQQVRVFQHPGSVYNASFSHNNTQLVTHGRSGYSCKSIHVWDANTGQQLRQFEERVSSLIFSPGDQYLIRHNGNTITFLNAQTYEPKHVFRGFKYWTTLASGVSYALRIDGWICRFTRLDDEPQILFWIPSHYHPKHSLKVVGSRVLNNPLFFETQHGIQLCLPRRDGLTTIIIPHDY